VITGAHAILYSSDPEAARDFLRDVLGFRSVDAGDGWLIFALPPAELGVHPSEGETMHQLSLLCDDIAATADELRAQGVEVRGEPQDKGFGVGVTLVLPGGVEILLYEPRHETAV
jgi:catechol 2,3-dioxygenase-like lactoylglutathione lyase family enzyme